MFSNHFEYCSLNVKTEVIIWKCKSRNIKVLNILFSIDMIEVTWSSSIFFAEKCPLDGNIRIFVSLVIGSLEMQKVKYFFRSKFSVLEG